MEAKLATPMLETESGFAASNDAGVAEQARTAVEKQVYAMSVGMDSLYFFRLFMEGGYTGGYGMTRRLPGGEFNQPLASILSYRHLVRRLPNANFVKQLPTNDTGLIMYLFEHVKADGALDGRKTVVSFNTNPKVSSATLLLQSGQDLSDAAKAFDMYGNPQQFRAVRDNVAEIEVGPDAQYLTWVGSAGAEEVQVVEPLVAMADTTQRRVLLGVDNEIELAVTPNATTNGQGTLSVETSGRVDIAVTPQTQTIDLSNPSTITLTVTPATSDEPLKVPTWWTVFAGADAEEVMKDKSLRLRVPDKLKLINDVEAAGVHLDAGPNKTIDIGSLVSVIEKRPAVAYSIMDAREAATIRVGIQADWYSAWYLNGELLYDRLESGNAHGTVAEHQFDLPLRKGRNVICAVVLSGSGGFSFKFVGPHEVAMAQGELAPDRVDLRVDDASGEAMTRLSIPLDLVSEVDPLGDVSPSSFDDWMSLQPVAILGDDSVTNPHMKFPDESRWYTGSKDLSAEVWMRDDAETGKLRVLVRVTDDVASAADGVRLVVADGASEVLHDALLEQVEQDRRTSLYHVALDRSTLLNGSFRMSLQVRDVDGGDLGDAELKQTADLGNVDQPALGTLHILSR